MNAAVIKHFSGSLTESEQELVVAIQNFLREAVEHRYSLVRILAAIGLRLDGETTDNDLLIVSGNIEINLDELKAADLPLTSSEEELLEDIDGFIRHCVDNGLRFELMRASLKHDINGILERAHGGSKPGYPRLGFSPRVSGYSKMDWDAWVDDIHEENARINEEFKDSESDGL